MTSNIDLDGLEKLARAAAKEPWSATVSGPDMGYGDVLVNVPEGVDWPAIVMHVHTFRPATVLQLISLARRAPGVSGKRETGIDGALVEAWQARALAAEDQVKVLSEALEAVDDAAGMGTARRIARRALAALQQKEKTR